MRRLFWVTLLSALSVVMYYTSGCGQWTDGSTDRGLDCVDGCTPEGVGNDKVVQGPRGEPGRDGQQGVPGRDGSDGPGGSDGQQGEPGKEGRQGEPGDSGSDGSDGSDGEDGYSVVISLSTILQADILCPTGGTRIQLAQDTNRNGTWDLTDSQQQLANICNGTAGQSGADGQDGEDGADGTDGQDAPLTPLTPVEIVDPCGDKPGVYDEVFIRFQDGRLIASFSENANGKNTRFSLITAGSYVTTDGTLCFFSVDAQGGLYSEHY